MWMGQPSEWVFLLLRIAHDTHKTHTHTHTHTRARARTPAPPPRVHMRSYAQRKHLADGLMT
jgi:hypothetical protein